MVDGLCHDPYAGITQIRFEGVDSVSAALSAWRFPSSPGAVFVLRASLTGERVYVKPLAVLPGSGLERGLSFSFHRSP